jgi:uncharacterized cupin superfamily protein
MNLRDAPMPAVEDTPPGFAFSEVSASERTGDELIGASLYEFEPGNQLWPYHFHAGNEEWAVVVSGTPTLRTPEGERGLRAGDVVGFPQGETGAHTFYNRSSESTRILFFSTLRSGYPTYLDSDKVGAGGRVFRRADAVDYWDGEESRA